MFSAPSVLTAYKGGILNVACSVTEHVRPPSEFRWFHNDSLIDLASYRRGGINIENVNLKKSSSSRLRIVYAEGNADGNNDRSIWKSDFKFKQQKQSKFPDKKKANI